MNHDKACEIYDQWTNSQSIPEFIQASHDYDSHLTFTKSIETYVSEIREDWDRASDDPVSDEEAKEAVEAIITVCRNYIENEYDTDERLSGQAITWVME